MVEVQEMSKAEIERLLEKRGYGHFACSEDGTPYVIPIHYMYAPPHLYFYTTDGKKTRIIKKNPQVCLQVEEVIDRENWRSVVINGRAEEVITQKEKEDVITSLRRSNPTLTPAISIRWVDNWIRENKEAIYRITPDYISGRVSVRVRLQAASARPHFAR